jgi:hypothetical protein
VTSAKHKYDWLKTKGLWGAKSPDNEKIVVITATLNALKGRSSWTPSSAPLPKRARRITIGASRRRTRRTQTFVVSKRETRHGRRNLQKKATRKRRKWENILTIGASPTWYRDCTQAC